MVILLEKGLMISIMVQNFSENSGEIKLEEAKKMLGVFKSNLNEISRARNKSEEQKSAIENIKLLYEAREAFIKLSKDYFSIISEVKYKTIHGKEF